MNCPSRHICPWRRFLNCSLNCSSSYYRVIRKKTCIAPHPAHHHHHLFSHMHTHFYIVWSCKRSSPLAECSSTRNKCSSITFPISVHISELKRKPEPVLFPSDSRPPAMRLRYLTDRPPGPLAIWSGDDGAYGRGRLFNCPERKIN